MAFNLTGLTPPTVEKKTVKTEWHNKTLTDDYAWLRADNWQEAMREPEALPDDIKAYLNAENDYQKAVMADTTELRESLIEEMKGRIQQDDSSVPSPDGAYAYWMKFEEGAEYPIFMRSDRDGKNEHVVFNGDLEGKDKDYFSLGSIEHSPDHKMIAWSVDENGSEYYKLRFRDLATGKDHENALNDVGGVVWTDEKTLYYTVVDESHRPSKVYKHIVGEDQKNDELIYEEKDPRFFCDVDLSQSERMLFINAGMNDQDECYFIDLKNPDAGLQMIEPRSEGIEYDVNHHGDNFIITTNADGAEDFKIVTAPISDPGRKNWKEFVAHKAGNTVLNLAVTKDYMIRMERENALPRIVIHQWSDGSEHEISFEEEAYALGLDTGYEYETDNIRFVYTSPTTPSQTYDYNMRTRERTLLKEQKVPSGHDASDYVARRLMVPSHDGELVPATILHKADLKLDGSAPCFLYAYGSYGHSMPASFSTTKLSIVDRGFVHVVAHIRGGADKGRAWYNQSKQMGKMHTFKDFIAVGEHLAKEGYTSRGKIVANGGSAGGMLMGAVANMAPSLFGGIIADVPFVDVLNTMLDDKLPLTPGEWSQWGNPIESAEAFDFIGSYSPYDNVSAQDYPPMLVTAGVSDPRVTYWEPAKWVAKLRELKTNDEVLLLKTNMTSGHFGQTGRFAALEDSALAYAFALKAVEQN
ncbi:MAG: S9 family peptidase [Nitratireductor sp.]